MNFPGILAIIITILSCGCSGLDFIRYDNPKVRKLQVKQLDQFLPSESDRVDVMKFFAPRVGFLILGEPNKTSVGSGRAAAVSRDGYYLTASHVIGDDAFYLSETKVGKALPQGIHIMTQEQLNQYIQTKHYRGRVVWRNSELDLAVVKFDKRNSQYFKSISGDVTKDSVLFSADDSGLGMIATDRKGSEKMIGNGPFLVAGSVTSIKRGQHLPDDHLIATNLIGRGGMSGSPLADRDGILRGIVLHIDVNHLAPGRRKTVAGAISNTRLQQIIAADRKGKGAK